MTSKRCIGCQEDLPLEEFYRNAASGYYQSRCKPCNRTQVREYRKNLSTSKKKEWRDNYRRKHHNQLNIKSQQILDGMVARSKKKSFDKPEWTREEIEDAIKDGRCAKTGIPFEFDQSRFSKSPWTPVPDRKDSSVGYTKDNVQWVCHMYNSMKQDYTDQEINIFIDALILNRAPGDF